MCVCAVFVVESANCIIPNFSGPLGNRTVIVINKVPESPGD